MEEGDAIEDWELTLKHTRVGRLADKAHQLKTQYSKFFILAAQQGHRTEFRLGSSAYCKYASVDKQAVEVTFFFKYHICQLKTEIHGCRIMN
jgi:hypothetical protein